MTQKKSTQQKSSVKKQVVKTHQPDLNVTVVEIFRKDPNGDPFDTMYARQRKSR